MHLVTAGHVRTRRLFRERGRCTCNHYKNELNLQARLQVYGLVLKMIERIYLRDNQSKSVFYKGFIKENGQSTNLKNAGSKIGKIFLNRQEYLYPFIT